MFKILFNLKKGIHTWDFHGGIYLPSMKNISNCTSIRRIPLAKRLIIPLQQHIGNKGELCVKVGDNVLRGQILTLKDEESLPVHASTSGKIISIDTHAVIVNRSTIIDTCVVIEADGKDQWMKYECWENYHLYAYIKLIKRIHQFGITGLGGAGFPTSLKLYNSINKVNTVIINATECEPYITSDDRLIQEYALQIMDGIHILAYIVKPNEILIGIEDNKKRAIFILQSIILESKYNYNISLRVIPTKYPSGSAKQLVQILTGKQVPHGGHLSDIGVLMQNISTVYAIKRAIINGEPLTERVVTITGSSVTYPGNIWVRLGTPISHLLKHAGLKKQHKQILIMGGPLMGIPVSCIKVPIIKTTNCLFAPTNKELSINKESNCIRCGACINVCPIKLLPHQLYLFIKNQRHDKALTYNILDCIECGACSWVCPSNIPLAQYFHQEKIKIHASILEEQRIIKAKLRFKAHQKRKINKNKTTSIKNINLYSKDSIQRNNEIHDRKIIIQSAIARVIANKENSKYHKK